LASTEIKAKVGVMRVAREEEKLIIFSPSTGANFLVSGCFSLFPPLGG
jgi:hypothetical protein